MSKKIFSGVQPTGNLHLGNYLGAIKNFVDLNNDIKPLYFLCRRFTCNNFKQDKDQLTNNIRETTATFLVMASIQLCIIFNQSKVHAHAEGSWILSCMAQCWLNRNDSI